MNNIPAVALQRMRAWLGDNSTTSQDAAAPQSQGDADDPFGPSTNHIKYLLVEEELIGIQGCFQMIS